MNDDKKVEKPDAITAQNIAQEMLPDDLKKKFVLQKNSPGTFDAQGNVATAPAGTPQPQPLDPDLIQKPIRTYESDLAEALSKKGGSIASISIAEQKRREEMSRKQDGTFKPQTQTPPPTAQQKIYTGAQPVRPTMATAIPGATVDIAPKMGPVDAAIPQPVAVAAPVPPQVKRMPTEEEVSQITDEAPHRSLIKPIIFTLVSLILIAGGVAVGYFAFMQSPLSEPKEVPVASEFVVPSILPKDNDVVVDVEDSEGNELISKIYAALNQTQIPAGKNYEVIVGSADLEGNIQQLPATTLVEKLDLLMPEVIYRSLTDRWMFGAYAEDTGVKTSYLVLTTDFFQNAFAGMLMWEDTMPDDLALLLNYKERARREELTSTSTISSYFSIRGDFSDKVIRNRDVREFKNPQGELLFLYSFINKETFVITTTESALIALLDRIEKEAYVR